MSQQPQPSSNETHMSFAAPAAINDTPGSAESGSGGTLSYVAPSSGTSTSNFTMVRNVPALRGSSTRSNSARSARPRRSMSAIEDNGGPSQTTEAAREGEVCRTAASSKRKSSGSATRNESELRLRRQLQHSNEKLDRSEQARTELEGRLKLFQDVLNHRDQMIHNVEVYSHQHFEEYQEHVNAEMEYMKASLANASNMLNEQSLALAEAHLMDEGSAMRIIELGRRGELAEQGTAHIIQESIAMRERYHAELESAVRQIQEQQEQSESASEQFRQHGQQLREACVQYVNEREKANKEEMESLAVTLEKNSQEMSMNSEMVMEHGRHAVAVRDERVAELQVAINEMSESMMKKDEIIVQRNERIEELIGRIERDTTDAGHRLMLAGWDIDNLKTEMSQMKDNMEFEMYQMKEINEAEIAERDTTNWRMPRRI